MVVFIIIPQFLKKAIAFFNFSRDKKPPVLFRDGRLDAVFNSPEAE